MKPLREDILEQGKKLKAAADLRERNERKIREAIRDFLQNPLSIRENMEKIRKILKL